MTGIAETSNLTSFPFNSQSTTDSTYWFRNDAPQFDFLKGQTFGGSLLGGNLSGFNWNSDPSTVFAPAGVTTSALASPGAVPSGPTSSGGFWSQVLGNVNASGIGASLGTLAGNGFSRFLGFGPQNTAFTANAAAAAGQIAQGGMFAGLSVGPGLALTEANEAMQRAANAKQIRFDRRLTNPSAFESARTIAYNMDRMNKANAYNNFKGDSATGFNALLTPGGPTQLPNSLTAFIPRVGQA